MSNSPFCLVVDASCDLPFEYLQNPQLKVLPVRVVVGDKQFIDRRERAVIEQFYRECLSSKDATGGRSEPLSVDEMVAAFSRELALSFDEALGVFVSASRSAIFGRAKQAVNRARVASYSQRLHAGRMQPIQVDCVDSQALFAGYAVQAMDLIDLVSRNMGIATIIERQAAMVAHTYAYMAPGDVSYILERASLKGEKSVSGLAGFAAKSLSIFPIIRGHLGQTAPVGRKFGRVKAQVAVLQMAQRMLAQDLLLSPHICLSYSGHLDDISSQPAYADLLSMATQKSVSVHLAPMSITGSVNVGPGALVVGVLAKSHDCASLL